jgi:hypothetical protein
VNKKERGKKKSEGRKREKEEKERGEKKREGRKREEREIEQSKIIIVGKQF